MHDQDDAEHGWACGVDCVDQTCRKVPDILRDLAEERGTALKLTPAFCGPASTPCYFDQIWDLANYIAANQQACVEAFFNTRSPPYGHQVRGLGGELDLDEWIAANDPGANSVWPSISKVLVDGTCGINGPGTNGWVTPPGPNLPCTDSNDNNDEDPFESGHGGGFWGSSTFVASSGRISLDGPSYIGIEADGTALMSSLATADCDTEDCTRLSFDVRHDNIYLQDFQLIAPPHLVFEANRNRLLLDDFRLHFDHPEGTPINPTTGEFTFEPGAIKAIASGKLYHVPIFVEVTNTSSLRGILQTDATGIDGVSLDPIIFGYIDRMGNNWTLSAQFETLRPQQRAPRADFEMTRIGELLQLDARLSSDDDGDALSFTWYIDGVDVGDAANHYIPWKPSSVHVVSLHVVDETGRDDWTLRLFDDE